MKPAIPKEKRYNPNSTNLTLKARQSLLSQAYYYIIHLGYSQKKTSDQLDVSTKTINNWVKKYKWDKKIEAIKTGGELEPIKFDESLSAFMAYTRIKNPSLYKRLAPLHKKYINSL